MPPRKKPRTTPYSRKRKTPPGKRVVGARGRPSRGKKGYAKSKQTSRAKALSSKSRFPALSNLANDIRGILNPFSKVRPRLFDGGCVKSLPICNRHSLEIDVPNTISYVDLYLYPSIFAPVQSKDSGSNVAAFFNGTRHVSIQHDNPASTADLTGNVKRRFMAYGEAEQWRVVSQGMRLTNLNTTSKDDGWFEAKRFVRAIDGSSVVMGTDVTPPVSNSSLYQMYYENGSLFNWLSTDNGELTRHSGASRDLAQLQFNLKPKKRERPFIQIPKSSLIDTTLVAAASSATAGDGWRIGEGDAAGNHLISSLMDDSMDCIVVRIYPGADGSKFLLEVDQNLEVIAGPGSLTHEYHWPAKSNRSAHDKLHDVSLGAETTAGASRPSSDI